MNLYFRMLYVYLLSFFRPKLPTGPSVSELNLMVLHNDLDINLHMNNGRYLSICDLNRFDFFIRTDLLKVMLQKKWIAMVSEHTMHYKRPLNLFQRFSVSLSLNSWDEKYFYMTHQFKIKDRIIAEGTSKGVVRSKEGVIPPAQVIKAIEIYRASKNR